MKYFILLLVFLVGCTPMKYEEVVGDEAYCVANNLKPRRLKNLRGEVFVVKCEGSDGAVFSVKEK